MSTTLDPAPKRTIAPIAVRRRQVIEAAVAEFLARGYEGASIDEIAARAGVSKPTIYKWHQSKAQLFEAAVLDRAKALTEELKDLPTDQRAPAAVLEEAARKILTLYLRRESLELTRLSLAEARRFPDIAAELRTLLMERVNEPLRGYLDRLSREGQLRMGDSARLATLFGILAVHGFRFLYEAPAGTAADDDHVAAVVDLFLHGVLVHPNSD